MQTLALFVFLAFAIVSVYALPTQIKMAHPRMLTKSSILHKATLYKRVVNYNNDAGSVAAATTIDTTTAALAGLDSAGKTGAATGTEVLNTLVDASRSIVSIAGAGLGSAGSNSLSGNFPTRYK